MGLFWVKVYSEKGMAVCTGVGMFPRAVMERFLLLPLEEEMYWPKNPIRQAARGYGGFSCDCQW